MSPDREDDQEDERNWKSKLNSLRITDAMEMESSRLSHLWILEDFLQI